MTFFIVLWPLIIIATLITYLHLVCHLTKTFYYQQVKGFMARFCVFFAAILLPFFPKKCYPHHTF